MLRLIQKTFLYRWFLIRFLPFFNFRIWGYPKYPMERYFEIRDRIRNKPELVWVFVGKDRWALSYIMNWLFTRAKWSHTGFLYLDPKGEVRIYHMIHSGFQDWSLLDYLREVDCFQAFPVPCTDPLIVHERLHNLSKLRPGYDFDFQLGDNKTLYCSELVWYVLQGLAPGFEPREEFGRKLFEPDDVWKAGISKRGSC